MARQRRYLFRRSHPRSLLAGRPFQLGLTVSLAALGLGLAGSSVAAPDRLNQTPTPAEGNRLGVNTFGAVLPIRALPIRTLPTR